MLAPDPAHGGDRQCGELRGPDISDVEPLTLAGEYHVERLRPADQLAAKIAKGELAVALGRVAVALLLVAERRQYGVDIELVESGAGAHRSAPMKRAIGSAQATAAAAIAAKAPAPHPT